MGCATSVRSSSTAPSDIVVHFKGPTRIVQDDVVDVYVLVQDYALPEGPFGGGSLGLKESQHLTDYTAKHLFRDNDFPADNAAILINDPRSPVLNGLKWLRPKDMVRHPQIGKNVSSLKRGRMSADGMVSALSVLGQRIDLLRLVLDPDQALCGPSHRGIVEVKLWRFGQWNKVLVDDLLPSISGAAFATAARDPNHFWPEFIEKAYAKLLGSYGAIQSSRFEDILVDLTGGVVHQIAIGNTTEKLVAGRDDSELIRSALRRGALIVAHPSAIGVSSDDPISRRPATHLSVPQPALAKAFPAEVSVAEASLAEAPLAETPAVIEPFRVVAVCSVRSTWGDATLICLRGPWGHHVRWTGAWAMGDVRWLGVSDDVRAQLSAVSAAEQGLFWMAWPDLIHYFSHVTVVMLPRPYGDAKETLHMAFVHGRWTAGSSAGGCRNDLEKFATNPQYLLTLTDPDDEEPPEDDPSARCSVIIALMQEHRRTFRETEPRLLPIAVFVYKADTPNERLSAEFFLCVAEEESEQCTNGLLPSRRNSERRRSFSERRHCFTDRRETVAHLRLPPGPYVLVPATFSPDCEQSFLVRVLSTSGATLKALPEHSPLHHIRTAAASVAPGNGTALGQDNDSQNA